MRYRTIVADPPWPMAWRGGAGRRRNGRGEIHVNGVATVRELPYPTLSIDAIAALPVRDLAEDDAHLYLWTPDRFAFDGSAARVAEAWGFTPQRFIVWRKTGFGLGTFPRPQHELLLVCKRGRLPFAIRNAGSVHQWKLRYHVDAAGRTRRLHSGKPDGALDLIERASPGPYLELFARRQRLGWDTWGDQALEHAALAEVGA